MNRAEIDTVRKALSFYANYYGREAVSLDALAVQFECANTAKQAGRAREVVAETHTAQIAFTNLLNRSN